MKKLEKLTKKQEKQLEIVKKEYLDLAFSGKEIDREEAIKGIKWLYKFSKLKEPIIIFLDSPFACQIGANYAIILLNQLGNQVWNQVGDQVGNQVRDQVENQVWNQVRNQVWNQVGDQVGNQVRDQVENQVGDQVRNQVWNQVRDQVENQVEDQVRNQVRNQVWNQVRNQVGDQVENQVRDQVRNQVENKLGNQVWDQVENQVWNQVWNQVRNQVWNQVWNQVGDQVWNQVGDQVGNQVRDQVENQVRNQVWNQVRNQVGDQVGDQVENINIKYFPFSYYGNIWDYGWLSFYMVFENLGIDFGNSTEDLRKFRNLIKSGMFNMIQLEGLCIVSSLPKIIKRNKRKNMHCENGAAIEFRDGYKQHYLNGVFFPEDLWTKVVNKQLSWKDIQAIQDIDQRTQAMAYADINDFIKLGTVVDTYEKQDIEGNKIHYSLLKIPQGMFTVDAYYAIYDCPSTMKKYSSGIDPEIGKKNDIKLAMAWKHQIQVQDFINSIPLINES